MYNTPTVGYRFCNPASCIAEPHPQHDPPLAPFAAPVPPDDRPYATRKTGDEGRTPSCEDKPSCPALVVNLEGP
jgi:hypothetical protein